MSLADISFEGVIWQMFLQTGKVTLLKILLRRERRTRGFIVIYRLGLIRNYLISTVGLKPLTLN